MLTQIQQNEERRNRANTALTAFMDHCLGQSPYNKETEPLDAEALAENLPDLIADLMHLAGRHHLDIFSMVESAKRNFLEEARLEIEEKKLQVKP